MACVPYANVVESIMYAMVGTRAYISHAMGVLSRCIVTPGNERWTTVKRVFRYLCGTIDLVIFYHGNFEEVGVHGFVDFDWAGDIDDIRSTSGYVFILFGGKTSWMSRKQSVVSLSTTKVEYIVATHAIKEAVWMQQLWIEFGFE